MNFITSTSSKVLLNRVINDLTNQQKNIFKKSIVIVPSKFHADKIKNEISKNNIIFSNIVTLFTEEFINLLAKACNLNIDTYCSKSQLKWLYYDLLQNNQEIKNLAFENYLEDKEQQEYLEIKIYNMAKQFANYADMICLHAPEIKQEFLTNYITKNKPRSFQLQKKLFQTALPILKTQRHKFLADKWSDLLAQLQVQEKQIIEYLQNKQYDTKQIIIYGFNLEFSFVIRFWNQVSKIIPIKYYYQSPCEGYWADAQTRAELLASLSKEAKEQENKHVTKQDYERENLLLISMGQSAREFQKIILTEHANNFDLDNYLEHTTAPNCLLTQVQNSINKYIDNKNTQQVIEDNSIAIFSSHTKLREVETIKNIILTKMLEDSDNINLEDFLITTANPRAYLPYLDLIFNQTEPKLTINISSINESNKEPLLQIIELCTSLYKKDFDKFIIFDLLENPIIYSNFLKKNKQLLQAINDLIAIEERPIFALNKKHKIALLSNNTDNDYSKQKHYKKQMQQITTWDRFLDYLWHKYFYAKSEQNIFNNIVRTSYLQQQDLPALTYLSRLINLLCKLYKQSQNIQNLEGVYQLFKILENDFKLNIKDSTKLKQIYQDFANEIKLNNSLRLQREASKKVKYKKQLEVQINQKVFNNWLVEYWQNKQAIFAINNINFVALNTEHAFPYKHIFILGANKNTIPTIKIQDTTNFLPSNSAVHPSKIEAKEKFNFLMLLLNAEQSFNISYIGQTLHSSEPIPPATVVTELINYLYFYHGLQITVKENKLNKYIATKEKTTYYNYSKNTLQDKYLDFYQRPSKKIYYAHKNEIKKTAITLNQQDFEKKSSLEQLQLLKRFNKIANNNLREDRKIIIGLSKSIINEHFFTGHLNNLEKREIIKSCLYFYSNYKKTYKQRYKVYIQQKQSSYYNNYQQKNINESVSYAEQVIINNIETKNLDYVYYESSDSKVSLLKILITHIYNLENNNEVKDNFKSKNSTIPIAYCFLSKKKNPLQLHLTSRQQVNKIKKEIINVYLKYQNLKIGLDFEDILTAKNCNTDNKNTVLNLKNDFPQLHKIKSYPGVLKPEFEFFVSANEIDYITNDIRQKLQTTINLLENATQK